jgi:thiamine biosynthesis lipoprotein
MEVRRCRPLLGTFVEIDCDDERAIEEAFEAVAKIHRLMSAHEPESDISRINRLGHLRPVKVDELTAKVIERALFWSRASKGAFDIVGAGKAAIAAALIPLHAGQPRPRAGHWTWLEIQGSFVRFLKPGCIDLGGIAKGFAVDQAMNVLRRSGCKEGLVNAGGDLAFFGPRPLKVTLVEPMERAPVAEIDLEDGAVATSAGLASAGTLSFDHLTGTRDQWTSVSVSADNACDADALTKIVWALGQRSAPLLAFAEAQAFALRADASCEVVGTRALAA